MPPIFKTVPDTASRHLRPATKAGRLSIIIRTLQHTSLRQNGMASARQADQPTSQCCPGQPQQIYGEEPRHPNHFQALILKQFGELGQNTFSQSKDFFGLTAEPREGSPRRAATWKHESSFAVGKGHFSTLRL